MRFSWPHVAPIAVALGRAAWVHPARLFKHDNTLLPLGRVPVQTVLQHDRPAKVWGLAGNVTLARGANALACQGLSGFI